MLPVIILSTHNMGLGVIRSLGPMGIPIVAVYYEKNDMGFLSKYVTEAILAIIAAPVFLDTQLG